MQVQKPWLQEYPAGVPAAIPSVPSDTSLLTILEDSFRKYGKREAFINLDKSITYAELQQDAIRLAAWLQSLNLAKGSRVAVMLPNVLQYPIAAIATLMAGLVLVNVNPLYTPRELEHQLTDSGSEVLIILENFAHVFQEVRHKVPVKHVVVASVGDRLGLIKGNIVNLVVRRVKKQVPVWNLPGHLDFNTVLKQGKPGRYKRPDIKANDIALLQYTGGTTGVSKGAELLHSNIVANINQVEGLLGPVLLSDKSDRFLIALPMYHMFAFMVAMLALHTGNCGLLIANPRDLDDVVKQIRVYKPAFIPAVNTLFNALANYDSFKVLDFSNLRLSMGGGMAVMPATAALWKSVTGNHILEGYGLSETGPVVSINPPNQTEYSGSIGIPVPSTEVALLDDDGNAVGIGEAGEIAVRGPQVMNGYWNRPDETAKVMTADGFFKTGDIGMMDERGYLKILDRKKDMIIVSGFNVFPNEIEDVVTKHAKVLEAAAVGVPDDRSGELPKIYVVKRDQSLTEAELREYLEANLTGYKRPSFVEFIDELPKSNVGKILRKDLRELAKKTHSA